MLGVDVLGFLFNQKHLINLLDRMQRIDDKLLKENIKLDNRFTVYIRSFIYYVVIQTLFYR